MSTDSDAVGFVSPSAEQEQKPMSIGIFYHLDNQSIAERIKEKTLDRFELVINLFDEGIPAGKPLTTHCVDFIDKHNSLWWIATENSMVDEYSGYYMLASLDESIRNRKKHFTMVAPEESLEISPPRELQHMQPLKENNRFIEQLESTLKWIESKQKGAKMPKIHPSTGINLKKTAEPVQNVYHITANNVQIGGETIMNTHKSSEEPPVTKNDDDTL